MLLLKLPGRLIPAAITSIVIAFPIGYLIHELSGQGYVDTLEKGMFPIIAKGIFYSALFFCWVLAIHFLSIFYTRFLFGPSVYRGLVRLLKRRDNRIATPTKELIYVKAQADFGLRVPSKEEEGSNKELTHEMLSCVVEAIISNSYKSKECLWYGFEYSFVQCFVSGCLIGMPASLMLICYAFSQGEDVLFFASIGMFIFYLVPVIFSQHWLKAIEERLGKNVFTIYAYGKLVGNE